jgi:hypothetical protein
VCVCVQGEHQASVCVHQSSSCSIQHDARVSQNKHAPLRIKLLLSHLLPAVLRCDDGPAALPRPAAAAARAPLLQLRRLPAALRPTGGALALPADGQRTVAVVMLRTQNVWSCREGSGVCVLRMGHVA